MDFGHDDKRKMLSDAAAKFLRKEWSIDLLREVIKREAGYIPELWEKMADLGWMGIEIDEAYGGLGGSFMDSCVILEAMGRALFPSPYLVTAVLAALILSKEGDEVIKKRLLSSIAQGSAIITTALGENGDNWMTDYITARAEKTGEDYCLSGRKLFVPYARASDYFICLARDTSTPDDATSLFLVDTETSGVAYKSMSTFSIDKYDAVTFDGVKVNHAHVIGEPGRGQAAISQLWPAAVVGKCVEMVGGLQKVLDMTVDYVKERKQFGVPIGSFQVIQHRCADMFIDV